MGDEGDDLNREWRAELAARPAEFLQLTARTSTRVAATWASSRYGPEP